MIFRAPPTLTPSERPCVVMVQGLPPFQLTASAFGAIPATGFAAALVIAGAGSLEAAALFWSQIAGASRNRTEATSSAGTLFLPHDAAFLRLLGQVGLPQSRAGLDRLLRDRRGLPAVGFTTINDGFSSGMPTALALLHAAVAGYAFVSGTTLTSASFPVGPMPTLLPTFPVATLSGVFRNASGNLIVSGAFNGAAVLSADTLFCGGFVVHIVDDFLWPSPTPRDTVARARHVETLEAGLTTTAFREMDCRSGEHAVQACL